MPANAAQCGKFQNQTPRSGFRNFFEPSGVVYVCESLGSVAIKFESIQDSCVFKRSLVQGVYRSGAGYVEVEVDEEVEAEVLSNLRSSSILRTVLVSLSAFRYLWATGIVSKLCQLRKFPQSYVLLFKDAIRYFKLFTRQKTI